MIRRNRTQSSSLFLMELILAILFFSIASAICVQFFVKSHLLSKESQILTQSVNECSSIAEICKTCDSISSAQELIMEEYSDNSKADITDDSTAITLYYDQDFTPCINQDHTYKLIISLFENDNMLMGDMNVFKSSDSSIIYHLEIQHHIARRTAHETR
ncbi:MAG: hypothetical protein ACOCNL_13240 [Acetivibrio ethanolgignens]